MRLSVVLTVLAVMASAPVLTACEGGKLVDLNKRKGKNPDQLNNEPRDSIFGEGGFNLFGGDSAGQSGGGSGIGVNSYLWRATLDTISFMPVASADPFGGVIITDWHSGTEAPDERFKLNVYILGRTLRADGIRVAAFRQVRQGPEWVDAAIPSGTETQIEDAILTKARQMRNVTLEE